MISQTKIRDKVEQHINYIDETRKGHHRPLLRRKRAKIIDSTTTGLHLGYLPQKTIIEGGKAYTWDRTLLTRAVFKPKPVDINGQDFYLELKGYGANGKELYPYNHCEGDLFYGMYLDIAKKEFYFLKTAETFGKFKTQKAIALLQFSKEEFIRHSIGGLAELIKHSFRYTSNNSLGKNRSDIESNLMKIYKKNGLNKVRKTSTPILKKGFVMPSRQYPFKDIDLERRAGYLIRATRAPFRIGSGKQLELKTEDIQEASYEGGRLYRKLLDNGILHLVPSQGNITIAGELMDFEDAEWVSNTKEIRRLWEFYSKYFEKEQKLKTFSDFLQFTFGKFSLEEHMGPFLNGTSLGKTPKEVASSIIDMHRKSFGPLLEERLN